MSDLPADGALPAVGSLSERWLAAWVQGTPQTFGACCAVAVRYEDPIASEPTEGLDALAAHARRLRQALPDLRLEPVGAPLVQGAFGCLAWRLLATHRGEIAGLPATGRFVTLHGLHYVELSDGLIRRARGFFDLYSVATQLGLLPARGSLGESAILMLRGFGLRPRG